MGRILITSGPTRQYLDPVRYLTNASSGRMGAALAEAALAKGHDVVIVSGPVYTDYPTAARVIPVVTTDEMLAAARTEFDHCEGLIGVAAPCDYRPNFVADQKLTKTGQPLQLELHETEDIVAILGAAKGSRWVVGFALETNDHHFRAMTKLQQKCCDLIVLNDPSAMQSETNRIVMLDSTGSTVLRSDGPKQHVADAIMAEIHRRLIRS